jgi:hypothetical protein
MRKQPFDWNWEFFGLEAGSFSVLARVMLRSGPIGAHNAPPWIGYV